MFWITSKNDRGRTVLLGPHNTRERAQEFIDNHLDYTAQIYELPTSDPRQASRILKHGKIEREGIDEGTRNFRHSMETSQ